MVVKIWGHFVQNRLEILKRSMNGPFRELQLMKTKLPLEFLPTKAKKELNKINSKSTNAVQD